MALKRKREEPSGSNVASGSITKLPAGTQSFKTGQAVKSALAGGQLQAITSFYQQIWTERSDLPLAISHPTVVILQHYLEVSPLCEDLFDSWREADRSKALPVAEKCVTTLSLILRILSGVPFFRATVTGIVNKVVGNTEQYPELLCRLISSDRRESTFAGLALASSAIAVDPPNPASSGYGNSGRLASKVWSVMADGGCMRALPKLLTMRRRDKEGNAIYREDDPLDKPDMRHLCLEVVLPMLSTQAFSTHSRQILRSIYNNLDSDPPITILRTLTAIYNATCLPSPGIGRKISLTLLDENALDQIIRLLDRDQLEITTGKSVGDIAMSFLETVTTDPGRGVCFQDEGWYPRRRNDKGVMMDEEDDESMRANRDDRIRRGLHNRILSNVVRKLGARVVSDKGRVGEWVIKVLRACPELVASYWPNCSLLIEPRLDSSWFSIMSYVGRIISLPLPDLSTFRQPAPRGTETSSMPFRPTPPTLESVIESIFPSPLTNVHLTKGLMHADHLVQYMTAVTLARAMQKLDDVQRMWKSLEEEIGDQPSTSEESPWAARRREIEYECRRRAPEPMVIIAFAQKSATMAPGEPETPEEKAIAAKSAMLTEVALRLFGLYYHTMPSLTYEIKFDVGRLLVSSSSNKAERKERQAAKAAQGSVVAESEVGSLRSVGTAGTAGMGGGFGYARGDVEGFEALSQVHVIKLLADVKEWQWTNKAAGSQYTYLYHILQLYLSTKHPVSSRLITELLRSLLLPTLIFDADPSELDIYLSALPPLNSSPWGIIQQVYILSFLDDAFKRCLQRPYKYIEDAEAVIPDYVAWDRQEELPNPLLMVIMEQVIAKVVGSHIGSDAAVVILQYLGRVLIATLGKQPDGRFVKALVERMKGMLQTLKEKGLDKPTISAIVNRIKKDVWTALGEKWKDGASTEEIKPLTDEEHWDSTSFERICLDPTAPDLAEETQIRLKGIIHSASPSAAARYGRFSLLLLASSQGAFAKFATKLALLRLVIACFERIKGDEASQRLKRGVFESEWMKAVMTSEKGEEYRQVLDSIVAYLEENATDDIALAEPIITAIIDRFTADKKNKALPSNLAILSPWARFLDAEQAKTLLSSISSQPKRLTSLTEDNRDAIGKIVSATRDATFVSDFFGTLIDMDILAPLSLLLAETTSTTLVVDEEVLERLVQTNTEEAFSLLRTFVEVSPAAVSSTLKLLKRNLEIVDDAKILPVLEKLCDLPIDLPVINTAKVVSTSLKALAATSTSPVIVQSALKLLRRFPEHVSLESVQAIITSQTPFTLSLVQLAKTIPSPEKGIASYIVGLGLRYLVRVLSSDDDLASDQLEIMETITTVLRENADLQLDILLVEPVIIAIIQERLKIPTAIHLAARLSSHVELKASFVRQYLQSMFSNTLFSTLTPSSTDESSRALREPIIRLTAALFHASPYASCQPNLVEPLLPLYGGTLSLADQSLLRIFQLFEAQRKVSIASLLRHWNAQGKTTTGGSGKLLDALLSLDGGLVLKTCGNFPIRRKFELVSTLSLAPPSLASTEDAGASSRMTTGLYDPLFVLLLFGGVLVEGEIRPLDWVEILRSNVLGMAVCALASRDAGMRRLASWVLAKAFAGVSATNFQERDQLLYTMRLMRHVLPSPSSSDSTTLTLSRLPTLTTLFLAHALHSLANPSSFLYPLTSQFLLQRPTFDAYDVPMLFGMLYSATEDHKRERSWIVRLIRDGTRAEADWRALKKRRTWSLLATIFGANPDTALRRLILQAMVNMSSIPAAARSLCYRNGLISWAHIHFNNTIFEKTRNAAEEQGRLIEMVEYAIVACADRVVISTGPKRATSAAKGLVDAQEQHSPELSSKDKGWITQAQLFVGLAARSADLDRLDMLSRMALRISSVPHTSASGDLLPVLTDRLASLLNFSGASTLGGTSAKIVEILFRISLCIQEEDLGMETVSRSTRQIREWLEKSHSEYCGSEVAEWMARERRRAEWEDWTAEQEKSSVKAVANGEGKSKGKKGKKGKGRESQPNGKEMDVDPPASEAGGKIKGQKGKKEKKSKSKSS